MHEVNHTFNLNIKIKVLLIFALFFLNFIAFPQRASQKFTHYGKQDGLNQSSVNFIYQDSEDYLWLASFGGINKFDGYSFTSYTNEFNDNSSISDDAVWTILERHDKTLWFGTKMGLSKYNRQSDNFTNYFIRENNKSVGTLAIKVLFEDKKNRFYVGSEGEGLYTFSIEKETFSLIKNFPNTAKVTALTEDMSGNLWVGTENMGLFQISLDRSEVISFVDANLLSSTIIWSLYADEKNNIWIGTDEDGLVRYNSITNVFDFYKESNGNYNYKAGKKIKFISKGNDNILWIGSATKGLSYYSYKENRFYNYLKDPYNSNSLYDNDVSGVFSGANNVVYVGFYTKGFDKMIRNPFYVIKNNPKKENTLSNDNVYCMYLDHEDILWLGTYGGGLNRYDPKTKKFTHFLHDENDASTISHDWVRIIYEDKNDIMWIGTWGGGLNKFDKSNGSFKRYSSMSNKTNDLNHNIVTALFEDKDGELWIGTYGGGINIYQPETDDFRSIAHDQENVNSISDDHITSFYQDENEIIWICTYGGGLNAYDKRANKFERFLPNPEKEYTLNNHKTLHIFEEPEHDFFWITTLGGGINKYKHKEKKFTNFTKKDGLSNNSTMGMLKDDNGKYWISSNNGLSCFDPINETFVNYTMNDGLGSDDYNLEAYAKTKDGMLYFGGKKGVTYFDPKDVVQESKFPRVTFTNIKIEDSIYTMTQQQLEIPYKSRAIFEYVAINPDKTDNIRYAYQLVGQDKDWNNMDKNRYLEFTNLNPGEYELRVKSTNSAGTWNKGYSGISLYVPAPWYMNWYFRGSSILIFLLVGYGYYRIQLNRAQKRNKLLEKTVKERTKTIKEKNKALEIEKDKTEVAYKQLKKLEGFKDEFTSMLAHDLKNPLVTILGYSSENSSDIDLQSINKSGKKMLNLIENMLEVQKFESTEVKFRISSYNLRNIAIEAINQVELLVLEKRIQIINDIRAEYTVNIDKEVVERVFVNLLSNAIKFSTTDSKIKITGNVKDQNQNEVVICIQDYGTGISEDQLPYVFAKFSQAEARDSGVTRSTGLGLTFCKMAIEGHGGKIWVDSEISEGSSFFFTLPKLQDSMVTQSQNKVEKYSYENPLHSIRFEAKDFILLRPFSEKINTLTIYEMGEWLDIFENLNDPETGNIKIWKSAMMEALTSFDENAFSYLKNLLTTESIE